MIAQTIQLALAPVFVLVAIGNIMNILSTRLGRIVDRSRVLQEQPQDTSRLQLHPVAGAADVGLAVVSARNARGDRRAADTGNLPRT